MNIYSIRNTGVAGNIWKFAVMYVTNKRSYIFFLSIFLLTLPDTTAKTIGLLSLIGQIAGFLFEIPSGFISDIIGHKKALVIAKFSLVLSSLSYIFADSFWYFVAGAIFLAIGIAMNSGTQSAFLKESLDDLGRGDDYSSISGKLRSIGFAIPVLLILITSFIAEIDFRWAFSFVFLTDIIGLFTSFSLSSPKVNRVTEDFNLNKWKVIIKEYFSLNWLPYVIGLESLFALSFGITAGFKNPFQESLGFSIALLGIFWAVSRVGISGVLLTNGWLKTKINLKQFIILQAVLYAILFISIGLTRSPWFVAVLFILPTIIRWGFSSLRSHFYLEFINDSKYKASLLSINTFIEKIMTGIIGFAMGYSVFIVGYHNSYLFAGLLFIIIIMFSYIFIGNKKTS